MNRVRQSIGKQCVRPAWRVTGDDCRSEVARTAAGFSPAEFIARFTFLRPTTPRRASRCRSCRAIWAANCAAPRRALASARCAAASPIKSRDAHQQQHRAAVFWSLYGAVARRNFSFFTGNCACKDFRIDYDHGKLSSLQRRIQRRVGNERRLGAARFRAADTMSKRSLSCSSGELSDAHRPQPASRPVNRRFVC
jgi:hypothetical protein